MHSTSVACFDVISHARLFLFFFWRAAEPLADARGTLGFRGTPVEKHCPKSFEQVFPLTQAEVPQAPRRRRRRWGDGESGWGISLPSRLKGLWMRRKLPHEKRILCILSVTEHFCLQDIVNISEMRNYTIQLFPSFPPKPFPYFLEHLLRGLYDLDVAGHMDSKK